MNRLLVEGMRGNDVKQVQQLLIKHNLLPAGSDDGIFGDNTERAVKAFQKSSGDVVDGIVGKRTWDSLNELIGDVWKLQESDYIKAAKDLQCEVAAIKAVSEVESAGDGFIQPHMPKILFERHWMCRKLKEYGLGTALVLAKEHLPNIVATTPGGYKGGVREWGRYNEAYGLNKECAIEATSWGRFQIMGFHYEDLGYKSQKDFAEQMSISESEHLEAFVKFIKKNPSLLDAIRSKDWAKFAYHYNGRSYRKNKYDIKMEKAYKRITK